jgi:putative N6-adenine-specific DNA methylase
MKSFYYKLGESLRVPGWRVWVLSGNPAFESAFHSRPSMRRDMWNGPIACTLLGYRPPVGHLGPEAGDGSEAPLGAPHEPADVAPVRPQHEGEEDG